MIDRYLLRIVVVLSFLLGLFSPGLEAQEREEVYPKELLNVIMRGAGDPPALPSLDASYCSDDEPIDIYVEETLPPNVTTIQWTVQVNMGGTLVAVSDYHESIGSSPNLGIRLFPDRFSEEHLNRTILISYNIVSGSGSSGKGDYTHVLKKPTVYNLSVDGFEAEVDGEICIGESVTLILDGSEVGVNYFLQRDGVDINPFPQEGTGEALSWTNISVGGEYSVLAVNSRSFQFGPDVTHTYQCSSVMNETPFLTVHPLPVPTANSDKSTYCVGEPIQLSGGPDDMASYSWKYPDGNVEDERNPLIASADYSSHNGTYTLTVESADGCINTTTLNVVVNENPTATLPADFNVCEDAPLTFTTTVTGGAGPYSYAWTKDGNPIGESTATISVPNAALGDAGVYEVTVTDANGCGAASASISIGVNESPVIGAVSNEGPACEGESIQLSSSGVTGFGILSYAWTGPNGYSSSDENPLIDPVTLADAGVYTLVVSDESGCSNVTETTTVVVDALPEATLSGDAAVCVGATGSYTAGGGDQYTFTVLDASNTTVQSQGPSASNTFETLALAVGSYTIQVLVENAAGCTAEESVSLTVNAAPEATIAFDPAVICEGESSELVVELTTDAAPWSLSYNDGSGLVSRSGITGLTHREEVNHTSNVTYTLLSITDANGCTATPGTTAEVTVNEVPTATLNPPDQTEFCHGTEVTFTAEGGDVYAFYRIRGEVEELVQVGSSATYSATDFEDGDQVFVVVTDANDCSATSSSIALTVWPLPEAGITVSPQYAGEGDNVTIAGGGGEDYLFLVNGEPYDRDFEGWIAGSLTLNTLVNGDELSVIARNEFGCVAESETITMTIDAYPIEFDWLPIYYEYCENDGGATLYLEGHEALTSIEYELYEINDMGNPLAIIPEEEGSYLVWNEVPEGEYRVVARRLPGGLEKEFADVAEVKMNSNPAVFDLVAVENPTICEVSISLSGSEPGVYYYLQLNGDNLLNDPREGTGSALDFDSFPFGGTYSILAVSPNGCSTEMNNPYLKEVTPNSAPFTVSSDPVDGAYCEDSEGVTLLTDGSQDGAAYQVYYNGTALGEGVLGNGAPLSFGPYTNEGTYSVVIAGSGGCLYVLDDAITVSKIPLPDPVTLFAENDGHFCEGDTKGVALTQTGFQADVNYALYYNGEFTGSEWTANSTDMSGSHSYGNFSQAGTYTIQGTTILGECLQPVAELELVADALPTVFELSGDDFYCGPDGQTILTLSGSQSDVEYTLYRDDVPGATQSGNGGLLNYIVDQEGEYRVEAVYKHEYISCPLPMNGIIQVEERALPDLTKLVNVDVSGADCTTGAEVTLLASEPDVEYEIYWWADEDNNGPTGSILSGDGSDLVFSAAIIDGGGSYRVRAIKDACPAFMDETFTVDIPNVLEKFHITGEGAVCEGDGGVVVGLSGSETDVTYSLLDIDLGSVVGSPINTAELPGYTDGDALTFGIIEEAGNYIVVAASNDGTCSLEMNGVFELRFNPLPEAFRLTGSGAFCDEGVGAAIGLDDSEKGVLYTLIWDNAGVPRTRGTAIGSDEALFFEGVSDEGNYTVYALNILTGCTSSMNGTVEVVQKPAPSTSLTLTANDYCADSAGGELRVEEHEDGVYYHLFSPDASGSLIQTLVGTGGSEDLVFEGLQDGEFYTLYASWEDEACMVALSSDISVSPLDSPDVPVLNPIVENPTCAGEAFVSVTNPQEGVVYYLINTEDASQPEDTHARTGSPIVWDETFVNNNPELVEVFLQVVAVNETTGCRVGSDLFRIEVLDAPGDFELESAGLPVEDGAELSKCSTSAFNLSVSNSQEGVLYRLFRQGTLGDVRLATVEGNDGIVNFDNVSQWPDGEYYVVATNPGSQCSSESISFKLTLLGNRHDDIGVSLHYSDDSLNVEPTLGGVEYRLYREPATPLSEPVVVFENFEAVEWAVNKPGTYYVAAVNEGSTCPPIESNRITITDVTLPVTPYSLVDPVLEYCSGDAGGIDVVLTGTTAGVYYELVKLDDPNNPEVVQIKKGIIGVDSLVFNGVEGTNTYSIWVDGSDEDFKIDTNDKTFVVTENPTPSSFLLSRGGAVNSHEITLSGSEKDVWYWLIRNGNFDFEEMPLVGTDSILNFGTVNKPGDYFVIAFGEGGCEAEMEGMANIYQSELVAVNDTLYLSPDDLAGTLDLAENDRFSFIEGLDSYIAAGDGNLRFRIVRPAKSGAEISLNEFSGMLSYSKLPSFYGEDFLEYRIENLDVPGRESGIGRVVIMVGNKDFNENQSFLLPNAFSPNGDGINERFVISGLGETEESTLEVFNRWGTIVYRSQGKQYDNSWDGTSNVGAMVSIGKELPNGVYFYVYSVKKNVNGSIQTRNYSGYVELRR